MSDAITRWNTRFRARDDWLEPDPWILEQARSVSPGRLLDVACGDGRNAVPLAEAGWTVVGVDGASEGLARLNRYAAEQGVVVETHQIDLEAHPDAVARLGRHDVVLISHFRPEPALWETLRRCAETVWLTTLDERQQARTGFRWFVRTEDLESLPGWEVDETVDLDDGTRALRGWVLTAI